MLMPLPPSRCVRLTFPRWRPFFVSVLALPTLLLTSCGTVSYYTQAARGQWQLQRAARPLAHVASDPKTDPQVRAKLAVVQDIRRFAAETLALPTDDQYATYADLQRRYAVWVVFAAPEFAVEPHRWWYPLVGSLSYRGFFSEAPARQLAHELQAQGLDTYVGGVEAYSTLGWLKDPVLNTFIGREEADLAELIFHELTHQKVYLRGDTDFNEALATAYAYHGVRRWLETHGRTKDWQQFGARSRAERAFISRALAARAELAQAYAASATESEETRRARKAAILENFRREALALRRQHPALKRVDRWFTQPVNNARLNTLATYYRWVPAFEALLEKHPHDAEAFFNEVQTLSQLPVKSRHAALAALIPAAATAKTSAAFHRKER